LALAGLSLAWVAGIFIGSLFVPSPLFLLAALVPLPLALLPRARKTAMLSALCLLALVGGSLAYQTAVPPHDTNQVSFYNDSGTVTLRGVVSLDPDVQDKTTRLKLAVESISVGGEWREVSGMVLLYVPRYPEYSYGDRLEVNGKLETPQNFADFDYSGYLAKQSVYSTMLYPDLRLISTGNSLKPLEWIYNLRHRLADVLARTLPEPQASLAQGIVLGLRGNIPDDVNADFARSGTTHVLAISGMNLTIIAGLLMLALGYAIGKRFYLYVWITLAAIWFYTALAGSSPSVVRSAIMASLFLIAELLGRQKNAGPALAFAAAAMVAFNPLVLWDVSFQLSVLSMAGVIFLYPVLFDGVKGWIARAKKSDSRLGSSLNFVLESFAMTLAASLAVWPATAAYFGMLSLTAPLATLLAVPVLAPIMVIGSLGAFVGLAWMSAAQVIGWVVWLLTGYLLLVARVFSHVPAASLDVSSPEVAIIAGYYGIIALIVFWLSRSRRKRTMVEMFGRPNETNPGMADA
jgi:competence protein ComEC